MSGVHLSFDDFLCVLCTSSRLLCCAVYDDLYEVYDIYEYEYTRYTSRHRNVPRTVLV